MSWGESPYHIAQAVTCKKDAGVHKCFNWCCLLWWVGPLFTYLYNYILVLSDSAPCVGSCTWLISWLPHVVISMCVPAYYLRTLPVSSEARLCKHHAFRTFASTCESLVLHFRQRSSARWGGSANWTLPTEWRRRRSEHSESDMLAWSRPCF